MLRATVSLSSSHEFHRDNNPRRREEVDDGRDQKQEREDEGNEVAAVGPRALSRVGVAVVGERGGDEVGGKARGRVAWEDGIERIVLIKRPRNVGRWLNPVIDLEARARRGNGARGKYSNSFITRSKNR